MSKYPSAFSLSFCLCLCFFGQDIQTKNIYIYGLFVMALSNFECPDLVDLVKFLTNFQPEPWKKSSFKWFYQVGPLQFWSRMDIHQPVTAFAQCMACNARKTGEQLLLTAVFLTNDNTYERNKHFRDWLWYILVPSCVFCQHTFSRIYWNTSIDTQWMTSNWWKKPCTSW